MLKWISIAFKQKTKKNTWHESLKNAFSIFIEILFFYGKVQETTWVRKCDKSNWKFNVMKNKSISWIKPFNSIVFCVHAENVEKNQRLQFLIQKASYQRNKEKEKHFDGVWPRKVPWKSKIKSKIFYETSVCVFYFYSPSVRSGHF